MADPNEFDDVMPENPARPEEAQKISEGMGWRLLYTVIIWIMVQLAMSVIGLLTIIQYLMLLIEGGTPNRRLARLGEDMGIWVAKGVRYLSGASEVKPWPWSELD
ncbi:MAG: DUF4389 domain-containing protein [Pseudomonadota bacterium]